MKIWNLKTAGVIIMAAAMVIAQPQSGHAGLLRKKQKVAKHDLVIYPAPPDTTRIQYLLSMSKNTFFGKRSKFASFVMGNEVETTLGKPYGIFLRNNRLYINDLTIAGMEIYDFTAKKYQEFVPDGMGKLRTPLGIYVDANEYIYVADAGRHDVVIFDSARNYVTKLGDTGTTFKPTEVTIYDNKIWVTNPENHKINIYDKKTRELVGRFPQQYEAGDDGFLYSPYNITITDDRVYITDFGDFKIKVYDHDGKFLNSIGSYGTNVGQFVRPKGIACDKEGMLYAVDAGFENVQIFNKDGQLLMFFGGPYKGPGDMWLPAKVIVDYDNLDYFRQYVDPKFNLKYLIIVSNQYGPDKISVYGAVSPK